MKTLRNVLTGSRLAGTMLISFGLCSAVAHGQDATGSANPSAANPNAGKVLRIVVPFAAGGAREVLLRALHSELGAALGQTAIIDNRPGAGGAIGTTAVARAEPDGNTLIFAASSHNVTPLLSANAGYDPLREFVAVANVGMQSYVLMSSQQFAVRNVSELLREARAHPGKHNYSSAGIGSSTHLAMD
jgi:tripartite-type tricarboxylate transporter receptor subunit TctC